MNEECRTNPCMKKNRYYEWSTLMLASFLVTKHKLWCVSSCTNSRTQQFSRSRLPNQLWLGLDSEVFNMSANGNPEVNLETGNHSNGGEEGESGEVQGVREREMGYLKREIYLQMELYPDEEHDSIEIK